MRLPLESSLGNTPQYPINFRALSKRDVMLPNSTTIVIAEMCASIVQLYYIRLGVFFGCLGIFSRLIRGEMIERSLHFYLLSPVRRS
jgi:hypothetical protein